MLRSQGEFDAGCLNFSFAENVSKLLLISFLSAGVELSSIGKGRCVFYA